MGREGAKQGVVLAGSSLSLMYGELGSMKVTHRVISTVRQGHGLGRR